MSNKITTISEAGVYIMSNEDYHADPCATPSLSRGIICELINKTPAHVYAGNKRLNPRFIQEGKEDKFDIGTASHSLFLEGYNVAVVLNFDDWRKKEAQEARDEARAAGKIPMLEKNFDIVQDMCESAHKQLFESELNIKFLHEEGKSEEVYIWQEGKTWCRCRTDWRSNDYSLSFDYKTTTCADPNVFTNKITDMGYDVQNYWYKRGMRVAAKLKENPRFFFMCQETKKPYLCSFVGLPPEFSEMGERKAEAGLFLWQRCIDTGEWPGYPKRICYVDPKPWALASWEEKYNSLGTEE